MTFEYKDEKAGEGGTSLVDVMVKILKVNEDRNCVEVQRRSGDIFVFYEYFKKV